jgi:hypothetical protein
MRACVSTLGAAAFALALTNSASASVNPTGTYWSTNAASCSVGDPAIQNNLYTISAGTVKFEPSHTGTITLYCNVPPNNGGVNPDHIWITYKDPDGTTSANHIAASFIKLAKSNGALTSITNASVDSNSSSSTVANHISNSTAFSETLDYENYYYYVRVDLIRTSTSQDEILYGVSLELQLP